MASIYTVTGQDPATDIVEDLGTYPSDAQAATAAEKVAERMAERFINHGLEDVHWENAEDGWRYEVWSRDGLTYVVRVEEIDGDE